MLPFITQKKHQELIDEIKGLKSESSRRALRTSLLQEEIKGLRCKIDSLAEILNLQESIEFPVTLTTRNDYDKAPVGTIVCGIIGKDEYTSYEKLPNGAWSPHAEEGEKKNYVHMPSNERQVQRWGLINF